MLGLSTGLVWDSGIKSLEEPPQENLVGHWDFTDITQMYEERDSSTTQVSSDGDPIGRCLNKAPVTGRLGSFVRAIIDNQRPTYSTGGANGNSYANFDNSSYSQSLVCRSTDSSWGAIGENRLSTTRLTGENLSIFIVGEPLDDDTDGSPEHAFSWYGYYDNPLGFDSGEYRTFEIERDDDDDIHAKFEVGGGVVNPNTLDSTQVANHWNSGQVSIINVQTSYSTSGSFIYTNNIPDVGQTIYSVLSGAFAQKAWTDFDPVNYDDSLTASISVGGKVASDGSTNTTFEGKIYEILVYKYALSESDRAALTYHLGYKYNATINA